MSTAQRCMQGMESQLKTSKRLPAGFGPHAKYEKDFSGPVACMREGSGSRVSLRPVKLGVDIQR